MLINAAAVAAAFPFRGAMTGDLKRLTKARQMCYNLSHRTECEVYPMKEKEIGEIRRHIRRDRSNMTAIYGCFVRKWSFWTVRRDDCNRYFAEPDTFVNI